MDGQQNPGTDPDKHDNVLYISGCDIGSYWMTGVIDEVALFNEALSEDDIRQLMNGLCGKSARCV